ncbi:MAG: hypothetical protein RJQ14_13565, partial [Marinoscillum sp.]
EGIDIYKKRIKENQFDVKIRFDPKVITKGVHRTYISSTASAPGLKSLSLKVPIIFVVPNEQKP